MNAYGNNNSFIMNTIVGNALVGIQIWRGENIVVFKNTVLNHLGPTDRGIHLHLGGDNFVNVSENIIDNNYYGIYLYGEADDIIHGNTISNNYDAI
jgi:parallel beta-helix repeat protein